MTTLISNSASAAKMPAFGKWLSYIMLAAIVLLVIVVRVRLRSFPLERDEGEYALMGQLILKGIPPYELAYNMKLPGTYYMYALLMAIFGQSPGGIHLGLLLVNLGSILLVYFIGRKLMNEPSAVFTAGAFALLSVSPGALGLAAHATHFNVLFGLGGLLALLYYEERQTFRHLFLAGLCLGLAFVMKQQSIFLLLFGFIGFWLIEWQKSPFRLKKSALGFGVLFTSAILPYVVVLLIAGFSGTFGRFWHWTVEYAGQYVGIKTGIDVWEHLALYFPHVSDGYGLFWILGLFGLVALFLSAETIKHRWLILSFIGCSLACVLPGFYFRPHYFIVFFPALALLVGLALNFLHEKFLQRQLVWLPALPAVLFSMLAAQVVFTHQKTFFSTPVATLCTEMYGSGNPFQASLEIAKFIRANSGEKDKIAILGSEPQLYFYSNRLPATGYIYTYPLMEKQAYSREMQLEMIAEIEHNRPKFLLFVNAPLSWSKSENSAMDIFNWYGKFQNNYNVVGLIDLDASGKATYVWREALNGYTAKNKTQIWVHERK